MPLSWHNDLWTVPEYRTQNELFHKLAAALMDYISNITTIIVLRLSQRARIDLESRNDEIFPYLVRKHRFTQVKCFFNAFLMVTLNVSTIAFYIFLQVSIGTVIMVGSVAAVFQYLDILMNAFGFYSFEYENVIHWWQDYNAAAEIFEMDLSSTKFTKMHNERIPDSWQMIEIE